VISASAIPRLLACPASHRLPHHAYQTAHATAGSDRHAEAEAAADTGGELHPAVVALMIEGDRLATECAFAYDCATDTARELGHVDRRYGTLAPYELPGTMDLLIRQEGRAVVVDYKSFAEVDPADRNTQIATYALMVARTYGLDEVTVAIIYLVGGRRPSIATLGPLDLDAHAARLRRLHVEVTRPSAPVSGPHCKYCPAFLSCPVQHALVIDVGDALPLEIERRIPFDDDQAAAEAFDLLARIKTLSTRIQAALYARAAERPVPLANGMVLGARTVAGNDRLDGDVVYQVVKEQLGPEVADAAVERHATKSKLEQAIKSAGLKVAPTKRAVLAEVEARGGIERRESTRVEVYALEAGDAA
jgi:CRISPR/Cas system-associated exonuclease Cas4 (RecB family)